MFLKVVTTGVIALILVIGLTQIIIPLWRGERLFPIFGRRARLERELERWKRDAEERELERQIAAHMAQALQPPELLPPHRSAESSVSAVEVPATPRKESHHE